TVTSYTVNCTPPGCTSEERHAPPHPCRTGSNQTPARCLMQRSTAVQPRLSRCMPLLLLSLVALACLLAATPILSVPQEPKAQRVIFGSAGFTESNRFWTIARPEH